MSTDAGTLQEARQEVVAAALQLAAWGLVAGASGNVSLRLPSAGTRELLAITPTQRPYDQLTAEDIVIVDFHGESVESQLPPSSETLMHVAAYRARPDVRAVVHSHSLFATVAAVRGCEIPPIIDEVVVTVGGPVKVSRYALPGTQELAEAAVSALEEHKAVLLRHHGLLSVGGSLQEALDIAHLVERAAQVFVYAALLGQVPTLPTEAVAAEQRMYRARLQAQQGS